MTRKIAFLAATLAILATAYSATAQQSAMPIVGWLNPRPLKSNRDHFAAFRKGLGEAGFVEGKNVMIELRSADGKRERLPALADDLVRRGVSVIMAGSPPAALAAKRATQTIPIVFTSGADPVKIGLVSSFNRPGGNVTGFHIQFIQLVKKRLSLLHEAVPRAARIAVLVNPANPSAALTVRDATETARALGLDLKVFNAGTVGEIDTAFAALVAWRAGAVFVGPDPFFTSRSAQIATLAAQHVVPTSDHLRGFVEAGGLMSYGPDLSDMYRRAGGYVGRILKGEKPADLPVQQPTKFDLVINLKTAKALGITIPPTFLLQATEVIK
jgi:putative ABC transport system substrate-binding protein